MSIPSRIIANSLGRNSTERVPGDRRGSLKTPCSRRLYHNTYPSRSHVKTFKRSARRERNRNRWPLNGSWLITDLTCSANRSKPQRMSVGSAASQIRVPEAPSRSRKLGNPITVIAPAPLTAPADDRDQIQAQPEARGPHEGELQSLRFSGNQRLLVRRRFALPQNPIRRAHECAASRHKTAMLAHRAPGKSW